MADMNRVVRQWLETEAAFGVGEVPLTVAVAAHAPAEPPRQPVATRPPVTAPPARPNPAAPSMRPTTPIPASPPTRPTAATPPAATPVAPATGNALFGAERVPARPVPARKAAVAPPPTPAGNVTDRPALSRDEKLAALAALHRELEAYCKPLLNDVSTRAVFGEGDCDSPLLFVGEGPGAEEDRTGRPFVGRSGQLLDKMIAAIGYKREQVYIANIVELRAADWTPDGSRLQDRPPTPEEVARGMPFLHRQIEIIRPRVIVTLGAPAVRHLTGTTEGVTKIRGTWLQYRGLPLMPTYHPSFVLRSYTEENRRKVWNDLKAAAARASGT